MSPKELRLALMVGGAMALTIFLLGCGGGSGSSSVGLASTSGDPARGASAEFLRPDGIGNKYVNFGSQATAAEREAASVVLEKNLEARAAGEFATQCATLDLSTIEEIVEPSKQGAAAKNMCPRGLKELAEPLVESEKIRADTLDGPIAVLRMKGQKAYALFHGADKKNYAIAMHKEGEDWKVASLVTIELK